MVSILPVISAVEGLLCLDSIKMEGLEGLLFFIGVGVLAYLELHFLYHRSVLSKILKVLNLWNLCRLKSLFLYSQQHFLYDAVVIVHLGFARYRLADV